MIWYHSKPDVVWYGILCHRELVEPRPPRIMIVIRAPTLDLKRFPTNQPTNCAAAWHMELWTQKCKKRTQFIHKQFTNICSTHVDISRILVSDSGNLMTYWDVWTSKNLQSNQSLYNINNLGSMSNSLSGNQEANILYRTKAVFLLHPLRKSQNSRHLPNYWSEAINDVPS